MPQAFKIQVPDTVLHDLKQRLALTRWPDEPAQAGWRYGANLDYLKSLVGYWQTQYDWRKYEAQINQLPQYKVSIDGAELHFIHHPSKHANAMPLLLSHGWPGSIWEFHRLIPMLTDPTSFGGSPDDAFTVVAPSLPGYTFSHNPGQRFPLESIAELFAKLMRDVLGYQRFGAQGGDWGCFVTSRLAYAHPELLKGLHLNLLPVRRDPKMLENPSEEDKPFLAQLDNFIKEEMGYQWIQGTKPQTLAFALTDSPVGLAAWIVEKFHTWSDCGGDLDGYLGRDEILTNIMLYWITGCIGASFWPYYARMHNAWPIPDRAGIQVPTGYAAFPKEILSPPRKLAERMFANIQRWSVMPKGGHFAALEQPALLAHEVREFFRPLR